MSDVFHRVIVDIDLTEGKRIATSINGWPVLVTRQDGLVHALINRCSHASATLADGRIRRGVVMCPLHGARFDLGTGKCVGGNYRPLKIFASRTADGWIEVAIPAAAPGPEHRPSPEAPVGP